MTRAEVRSRIRGDGPAVRRLGLAYLALGALIAAWAAWPIYEIWRVWAVAAAGAVIGIAAALLGRRLGGRRVFGAVLAAAFAVVGYAVAVVPIAIPSASGSFESWGRGIRDGVTGVVLGWKQVLTLEPPLGDYQAVLVPLLVVVLVGSVLGTWLVDAGGRAAPFAVAPVLAMSVFGVAFGTSAAADALRVGEVELPAAREVAIGVAVLATSGGWLVTRGRMLRRRSLARARANTVRQSGESVGITLRRTLLSMLLVAVALVGGIAVAPAAASLGERSALRDGVEPAVVVQRQVSPLAGYRSWFTSDALDEPVVEVEGEADAFDRLPFATLDHFDGEVFHVDPDTRYARLPRSAGSGAGLDSLEVTIGDGYSGVWVPAPAGLAAAPVFVGPRAEALADGFHVAEGGGAVDVTASEAGTGLVAGDRYRAVAEPFDPDGAARSRTAFSTTPGGDGGLDPARYPALAEWVDLQEVPRTGAGFLELVDRLRARGYLSHALLDDAGASGWIGALSTESAYAFLPSYAGHSRARIEDLFTDLVEQQRRAGANPTADLLVAGVGDDEQFAAAAALLARHLGFESRVVLGVRLPAAEPVPGVPTCERVCTGASMAAWAEVRSGSGDWVAVDATPQFAVPPSRLSEGEQLPKHPTVPDDARTQPLDPPRAESESTDTAPPAADEPTDQAASWWRTVAWVATGGAALALIALPFCMVLVVKALRRRRRRAFGDPETRAVAAWEELVDSYADAGIEVDDRRGRTAAAVTTGRAAAVELAALAERAVFAAHAADPALADDAWRIVETERRALFAGRRPLTRLMMALTLRSLARRLGALASPRARASRLTHPKEILP